MNRRDKRKAKIRAQKLRNHAMRLDNEKLRNALLEDAKRIELTGSSGVGAFTTSAGMWFKRKARKK